MASKSLDKEKRKAILEARHMIQAADKADCNEAETRRRIERLFEILMGYDVFKHLSRERAIRGAGETEHVDFAVQLEQDEKSKPEIMVEIKRISVDLAPKHLRQVASYAINAGCEWILLTNSKDWRLYHVSFGQPPITKLIYGWNILTDDIATIAKRFDVIAYKNLKKRGLEDLWQKTNVMHPRNLLQAILSVSALGAIRREIRRDSAVLLSPEEIVSGIRRLLNETALTELENVRISFPNHKLRRKKQPIQKSAEDTLSKNHIESQPIETSNTVNSKEGQD